MILQADFQPYDGREILEVCDPSAAGAIQTTYNEIDENALPVPRICKRLLFDLLNEYQSTVDETDLFANEKFADDNNCMK